MMQGRGVLAERGELKPLRVLSDYDLKKVRVYLAKKRMELFSSKQFRRHLTRFLHIDPQRDPVSTLPGLIKAAADPTKRRLSITSIWRAEFPSSFFSNPSAVVIGAGAGSGHTQDVKITKQDVSDMLVARAEKSRVNKKRPGPSKLGLYVVTAEPESDSLDTATANVPIANNVDDTVVPAGFWITGRSKSRQRALRKRLQEEIHH
jgi:hypothetical protein